MIHFMIPEVEIAAEPVAVEGLLNRVQNEDAISVLGSRDGIHTSYRGLGDEKTLK